MQIDLSKVKNFGAIDADTDPLLDEAFETHEAYLQAKNHEKYVIVGRKGSGKTAIYRRLTQDESHDSFSYGHVFSDYPWHHHSKQAQEGVPQEQCFVQSWEYLINITLAKILLNKDQSQPWSDGAMKDMATLEEFVVDTYGSRDPDLSRIFAPTTALKVKGEFAIDWKIFKGKVSGDLVPIEYLPFIVQDVNKNLISTTIRCANPDNNYYICFDELDLGFSLGKEEYSNRLIGLLLAARKFNNKAKEKNKKISVVIFLRDDIYRIIHFEDKNKLTESAVTVIRWDGDRGSSSLKALMEKRFHSVLKIPEKGSWNTIFDETELMTGKQSKYLHIIDRTFLRPRDIIKFCNQVLLTHNLQSEESNSSFSNKDITQARPAYSEYLLNELDDEIKKHYPDYNGYLEVLKNIGSLQFTSDDLEKAFTDRKAVLPHDLTSMEMASRLFDYSVIGFYRPGGGGFGGSDYVWKHKEPRALFNEKAINYRIHPGFMEVLGLKKFTRSS